MTLPKCWLLWGFGWLIMPRMTIGIMVYTITPYDTLGLILAILGAIGDVMSKSSD